MGENRSMSRKKLRSRQAVHEGELCESGRRDRASANVVDVSEFPTEENYQNKKGVVGKTKTA